MARELSQFRASLVMLGRVTPCDKAWWHRVFQESSPQVPEGGHG